MNGCPDHYEPTWTTTPTHRHPRSLRATLSEAKAGVPTTGVLRERDASQTDDEVRQSPVRLRPQSCETPWALLRVDLQGHRQNCQCEAHSRSDLHLSGRLATVPKTEVSYKSPRTAVADCPAISGQTGAI